MSMVLSVEEHFSIVAFWNVEFPCEINTLLVNFDFRPQNHGSKNGPHTFSAALLWSTWIKRLKWFNFNIFSTFFVLVNLDHQWLKAGILDLGVVVYGQEIGAGAKLLHSPRWGRVLIFYKIMLTLCLYECHKIWKI